MDRRRLQFNELLSSDGVKVWLDNNCLEDTGYEEYMQSGELDLQEAIEACKRQNSFSYDSSTSSTRKRYLLRYCAHLVDSDDALALRTVVELVKGALSGADIPYALAAFTWFSKFVNSSGHRFENVIVNDDILKFAILFGLKVDVGRNLSNAVFDNEKSVVSVIKIMSQKKNFDDELSGTLLLAILEYAASFACYLMEFTSFNRPFNWRDDKGNNVLHHCAREQANRAGIILESMFKFRREYCYKLLGEKNNEGLLPFECAMLEKRYAFVEIVQYIEADEIALFVHDDPFKSSEEQLRSLSRFKDGQIHAKLVEIKNAFQECTGTDRVIYGDLSDGKENLFIPIVPAFDGTRVPEFEYITTVVGMPEPVVYDLSLACACLHSCDDLVENDVCCQEDLLEECQAGSSYLRYYGECSWACSCLWQCELGRECQRGLTSKLELFYDAEKKWGLRCNDKHGIEANTRLGEYTGEFVGVNSDVDPSSEFFFETEIKGRIYLVDAKRKGNFTRFINHTCDEDPNVMVDIVFWDCDRDRNPFPHLVFYTTKKVAYKEELLINYGNRYWSSDAAAHIKCTCKFERCRYRKGA